MIHLMLPFADEREVFVPVGGKGSLFGAPFALVGLECFNVELKEIKQQLTSSRSIKAPRTHTSMCSHVRSKFMQLDLLYSTKYDSKTNYVKSKRNHKTMCAPTS